MIKKCFIPVFLLLFINISTVTTQFISSKTLKFSIDKFENSAFGNVTVYVTINSEDCFVASVGFAHLYPEFTLVSAQDHKKILFQKEAMFVSVGKESCVKGKFVMPSNIEIPMEIFDKETEFVLLLTLKDNHTKKQWKVQPVPFTQADLRSHLIDKIKDDFLEVNKVNTKVNLSDISFSFDVSNAMSQHVSLSVLFFLEGQECGRSIKIGIPIGTNLPKNIVIPYTELFIPPGENRLTYAIWGSDFSKKRQLFSGELIIQQPQLHKLSFETANADIDVNGLDQTAGLVRLFSKTGGQGKGDAYFEIRTGDTKVFSSPSVKHSGRIQNQKSIVQVYLDKVNKIYFMDEDALSSDQIEEYKLALQTGDSHAINVKKGRVLNFDFNYSLEPVTTDNYNQR